MRSFNKFKNIAIFFLVSIFLSYFLGGFFYYLLSDKFGLSGKVARIVWMFTAIFGPILFSIGCYRLVVKYTEWQAMRDHIKERLIALSDSRKNHFAMNYFKNQSPAKIVNIIEYMLASDEENCYAVNALGYLGREYGWEKLVPIMDRSLRDKRPKVFKNAVSSLRSASYNKEIQSLLKYVYQANKDTFINLIQKKNDMEYNDLVNDCEHLIELFEPNRLKDIHRQMEIAKIGEENIHILDEARAAAEAVMSNIPENSQAGLLLYMKVISKFGEERIEKLNHGPDEEHILKAGAKEFQSILRKYNIDSTMESRLD